MPKMRSDVQQLQKYVKDVCNSLAQELNITPEQSMSILKKLETEHYVTIESPQIADDVPATVLLKNAPASSSTLGMTSYKARNIPGKFTLNLHVKWQVITSIIPSALITAFEIAAPNPIALVCKVLPLLYTASELCSISFSENGTAIIMALQNGGFHANYSASEQQCFQDANKILKQYRYHPMDDETFQREIDILLNYRCIEEENGILHLREKVVGAY